MAVYSAFRKLDKRLRESYKVQEYPISPAVPIGLDYKGCTYYQDVALAHEPGAQIPGRIVGPRRPEEDGHVLIVRNAVNLGAGGRENPEGKDVDCKVYPGAVPQGTSGQAYRTCV